MDFTHLKDLIPKSAGRYQLQGELKAAMIINRASALVKEFFSEESSRCIRVKRFKNGILWLAVTNSVVAEQVQMKSYVFLKEINKSFGEELVERVRSFQEVETMNDE